MTDTTSRFSLPLVGDGATKVGLTGPDGATLDIAASTASHVMEPDFYNTLAAKVDAFLPSAFDNANAAYTAKNGAAITYTRPRALQHMRITLTNCAVTSDSVNHYGSQEILDLPNAGIFIVGSRDNLSCVKDGVHFISSDAPNVAVGTAAASNATLSGTMINVVEQAALAGAALTETVTVNGPHSNTALQIAKGASNKVYLNVAGTMGGGGSGVLTVSGTIDLFFFDFGAFS